MVVANVIGALSTSIKAVSEGISSGVSLVMTKTSAMIHNVADRLFPECAICYAGRVYVKSPLTNCRHKFHHECLSTWAKRQRKCPLDRTPLNPNRKPVKSNGARNRTLKFLFVGALVAGASMYAYKPFSASNSVNLGQNLPSENSPYFNEVIPLRQKMEGEIENGDLNEVNELLTSPRFDEFGNLAIEAALRQAVKNGHLNIVKALVTTRQFAEIEGNELVRILEMAARSDHSDILNVLITNSNFDETLERACRFGYWNAAKALIASERFAEIDVESFGTILEYASYGGELNIVNLLVEDPRFAEIDIEHFGNSLISVIEVPLWTAEKERELRTLSALIANPRFSEIRVTDLEKSLEAAVESGYLPIVEVIISSGRFAEISPQCLGEIFVKACRRGDMNILNVLLINPRFDEIDRDVFEEGFQHAINRDLEEANYWDVRHALTASNRFARPFSKP